MQYRFLFLFTLSSIYTTNLCCMIASYKKYQAIKNKDYQALEKILLDEQINDPSDISTNYNLGVTHFKQKKFDFAKDAFARSKELANASGDMQKLHDSTYNLAESYLSGVKSDLGVDFQKKKLSDELINKSISNLEKSIQEFSEFTKLDPENEKAVQKKSEAENLLNLLKMKQDEQNKQKEEENNKDKENQDKNDSDKNKKDKSENKDQKQNKDKNQNQKQDQSKTGDQKKEAKQDESSKEDQGESKESENGEKDTGQSGKEKEEQSPNKEEENKEGSEKENEQKSAAEQKESAEKKEEPTEEPAKEQGAEEKQNEAAAGGASDQFKNNFEKRMMYSVLEKIEEDDAKMHKNLISKNLTPPKSDEKGRKTW